MEYLCSASENCMTLYVVCVLPVADPHQMQPVGIIVCIAVAIVVLILACCLCATLKKKMKNMNFNMRRQDGQPVIVMNL